MHRSSRSGVDVLSVTTHELPANAPCHLTPERKAYSFWYRPRVEKGVTRVTIPELNLRHHRISRDHVLVIPPSLPFLGEFERANGRVARFSLAPCLFETLAGQLGVDLPQVKGFWHAFFAIDQELEALCRLLMGETESQCPHGPLYFEPLARALAAKLLATMRQQQAQRTRIAAVPPGIRRVLQSLESDFASELTLSDLAAQAQLSRSHFALAFRQFTGKAPHQYLLELRLSHARELLAGKYGTMSLSEIAIACGFFDQAHFSRHFRRFFGITPSTFQSRQIASRPALLRETGARSAGLESLTSR